ncbi:MAG TPA: hypothetical protein VHR39_03710 [Propionibacteriaceae bacterium]|nr:hypothetical protein [Propionibacteriaceae bacterium]
MGEVFGDDVVAVAMIDRLVHHADLVAPKATAIGSETETSGASSPTRPKPNDHQLVNFDLPTIDQFSASVDIVEYDPVIGLDERSVICCTTTFNCLAIAGRAWLDCVSQASTGVRETISGWRCGARVQCEP